MSDIRVFCAVQIQRPDGTVHTIGDTTRPGALTGAVGHVTDVTHALATGAKKLLWDAGESSGGETPTDSTFVLGYIVSDIDDVEIEITVDIDGNTALYAFQMKANIPFIIPSNVAYSSLYTANFATTPPPRDEIERIRAFNPSSTDAAAVRIVLAR